MRRWWEKEMGVSAGALLTVLVAAVGLVGTPATDVSHDGRALIIDGKRRIVISGSIHYPRSTPEMWPKLIQKGKEGGLDAIETYVFWNAHEPRRRQYNFEDNLDLVGFTKEIQKAGLYAILRIGPYACAEWNFGGFPVWLRSIPGLEMRTDNKPFEDEMQNFTTYIVNMMKEANLLAPQGGPIILTQIENEYGNVMGSFGDAGIRYINWCAKMAESLNVGVPWIMCQQSDAPQPMINTCNGHYCHNFQPNNPNSPKMWTENWVGWFKIWGRDDPHRPAGDVAYAVARFFQTGGTLQNYYMYHGGTNFGRTSGGPYITTSYDYDAPLDEYGNLNQPKWGHLKELHATLKSMEYLLTEGDMTNQTFEGGVTATKYFIKDTAGCFISNDNKHTGVTITFEGNKYFVPAWSVSILPECKNVAYNTAQENTQTSIMVKKSDAPTKLIWEWQGEKMMSTLEGIGAFTKNELSDQIVATLDTSDYLWYMTSVNSEQDGPMILRVNTTGHVLHAFVNGRLAGSQYAPFKKFMFVFESTVYINSGINTISLLSATVGLQNYGARFEFTPAGIVGGPVQLVGMGNVTTDLSRNEWSYKVGLRGEDDQLYSETPFQKVMWDLDMIPTMRPFTWYKTTFTAPSGEDPVVVDLMGMGKGEAWVNGRSIGRFWTTFLYNSGLCGSCDYREMVNATSNCPAGCNEPKQRWYHVPRSFLRPGSDNVLVLFEEAGGDPSQVNFQTVTVGTACGNVGEGKTLSLSCGGGHAISKIEFASFGNPRGTCGSFHRGSCDAAGSLAAVQKACLGQTTCTIDVSEGVLGSSSCGNIAKTLAVQATC